MVKIVVLFKGYVPTKDKQCLQKFKDRNDLKSLDEVKDLSEYAGILADDVILVDVDEHDQAELLMNIVEKYQLDCRVYITTRGRHFLFKNSGVEKCATKTKLACGIEADIKVGSRNSYSILKFNGQDRFIDWDVEEGREYQLLPKWMHPVKCSTDFLNMEAGDGRNQAMYNYELTLQSNDFSIEESRQCIQIINDFVLKEPLSQSELDVILRDEAFKKPVFFKGSNFLFDKFGNYIKNNNHIIMHNGRLHVYNNGIYITGNDEIEKMMLNSVVLNDAKRKEVIKYLNLVCEAKEASSPNLIAFRNGIFNIMDETVVPFSPDLVITNRIPWDYNPQAYSELADNTLNKIACNDDKVRAVLEECIGSCFYRSNELRKAFFFTGSGSNGKSTFIFILQRILGEENISALDLKELSEKFQNAELFGKLANLGDDISCSFNPDINIFKKITGGNRFQVQRKGERPFEFNPYCKLVFSANTMPRMNEKTKALTDRLLLIPFEARFTSDDTDFDPKIKWKLQQQDSIEYFIKIGIEGLKRVIASNGYSISTKMKRELDEYEVENNPVLSFVRDCDDEGYKILNEPTSKVYEQYQGYCHNNGFQATSKTTFSKEMVRLAGFKIDFAHPHGKTTRVFTK